MQKAQYFVFLHKNHATPWRAWILMRETLILLGFLHVEPKISLRRCMAPGANPRTVD
jgi:hypothetical protein